MQQTGLEINFNLKPQFSVIFARTLSDSMFIILFY